MSQERFRATKFLGSGAYSCVFSVQSLMVRDMHEEYALKRFFLRSKSVLHFALKEVKILRKIAADQSASPFLPTLFYSFVIHYSPVLVMNKASGVTLCDVVVFSGPLEMNEAQRCMIEIISGLRYLHENAIVHMELREDNILISKSGRMIISDFDRSLDLSQLQDKPSSSNHFVYPNYADPEIANNFDIAYKADIWNLGILNAVLLGKKIREVYLDFQTEKNKSKQGYWFKENFVDLPDDLQEFFNKVFALNPYDRPSIEDIQRFRLFEDIVWSYVEELKYPPPFTEDQLAEFARKAKPNFDSENQKLLDCLHSYYMPVICNGSVQFRKNEYGAEEVCVMEPELLKQGAPEQVREEIERRLSDYGYTNPWLYLSWLSSTDS